MHALVQIALGGMVAEEIFFGETTSGALSDLKVATTYAANMVGSMGMEGTLFSYEAIAAPHANLVAKLAASEGGQERVEALLSAARDEVRAMLNRNRHVIESLRDSLLERDELIGPEILEVINGAPAADHPPMVSDR